MEPLSLSFAKEDPERLLINISGDWKRDSRLPEAAEIERQLELHPSVRSISYDTKGLTGWDSALPIFLLKLRTLASNKNIMLDETALPEGVQRLLAIASAVPERKRGIAEPKRASILDKLGESALAFLHSVADMTMFIGDAFLAFTRVITGKARFRASDLLLVIQQCGAEALPIVSLISILVGLILAFIGALQLRIFGAQIYVANIVGVGMVRALAAIMTGVIMAGRTGASFAAQIGTMQVNEEVDALKTLGISPMEFLVMPRMIALFLMMPLLSLYADLMGVLGGAAIGVFMLDLNPMEYFNKTKEAVSVTDVWVGLVSSAVFGILVAISGCMRGMQCGRSAADVGEATTSSVVTSIVCIVVAMAVITVICHVLDI